MEVGMHYAGICCDLRMVDVPYAVFLVVDVDNGSLVHATDNHSQHSVLTSVYFFCCSFP